MKEKNKKIARHDGLNFTGLTVTYASDRTASVRSASLLYKLSPLFFLRVISGIKAILYPC